MCEKHRRVFSIGKKKKIEPDTHRIEIFCEKCNMESFVFFTNYELWNNVYILQWCKNCNRTQKWKKRKIDI